MTRYNVFNMPLLANNCISYEIDETGERIRVVDINGKNHVLKYYITLSNKYADGVSCRVRLNNKYYYFG